MTPDQTSEVFWQAVQEKNVVKVKEYSLSGTYTEEYDLADIGVITEINTGKIVIDGDRAEVSTTLKFENDEADNISLITILEKENEQWRVNYQLSMQPLMVNQDMQELMGDIEKLTEEFSEELEESVDEFKEKALPEIKSKLEEAQEEIRERIPELKNMIEEILEDLEESIEESFPQPEEEVQTQET